MGYKKGEWTLERPFDDDGKGLPLEIRCGGLLIAKMGTISGQFANAQLMVQAPKLYEELVKADETICELCKRLNPQHKDCTSCEDREGRLKAIAKVEVK